MPAFETMDRPQRAVLWPKLGVDRLGQFVVGDPVEIRVQWDDNYSEALDPQKNTVQVDGTIYTNRVIPIGSIVWQGRIAAWAGTGSGEAPTGLMEVKTVKITPDLKGRNRTYMYGLVRFNDVLPKVGFE